MIPKRNKQLLKGLNDMCVYLKNNGVKEIIEIGSWCGSSAEVFAKYFDKVTCVDPWEPTKGTITEKYNMKEVEKAFDKVMGKYDNIYKIKARVENIDLFSVDCIYIDADHHYNSVKRDIEKCLPFCKKYIAGHDYWQKKFPGVVKAVHEMVGNPEKIFCDSSWVKEIK
jgi:predicted N-acyltransferase